MDIMAIHGHTRVIGEEQGYAALPVLDASVTVPQGSIPDTPVRDAEIEVGSLKVHGMLTAWMPTEEERQLLCKGAPIILTILAGPRHHPPVMMSVGQLTPTEESESP